MDQEELRAVIQDEIRYMSRYRLDSGTEKKTMEFSKKLIIAVGIICALTWIITWTVCLIRNEIPQELAEFMEYAVGLMKTALLAYCAKSGAENFEKIKGSMGGGG